MQNVHEIKVRKYKKVKKKKIETCLLYTYYPSLYLSTSCAPLFFFLRDLLMSQNDVRVRDDGVQLVERKEDKVGGTGTKSEDEDKAQ